MSQNSEPFAFTQNQRDEVRILGDKAGTLSSSAGTHQTTYVAEPVVLLERAAFNQGANALYAPFIGETTTCPTLVSKGPHAVLTPIAFMMREDAVNDTFHAKEVDTALCLQALRPAVTSHHAQNLIVQPELYENHAQDSRVRGPLSVAPTVTSKYGTGGNNIPIINERTTE